MPVLKAIKNFPYNKQRLRVGDLFKCKDRHVPLLVAQGLAHKPEVYDVQAEQAYNTRHMEAKSVPEPKVQKDYHQMTVVELRAAIEAKGTFLPSGYIPKAQLIDILSKADF